MCVNSVLKFTDVDNADSPHLLPHTLIMPTSTHVILCIHIRNLNTWWHKLHPFICTTTTTTNKTLFNSCERLLLGTLIEHRNWSQKPQIRIILTLSYNKRGTDLGPLVVPFNQTLHPLKKYLACLVIWFKNATWLMFVLIQPWRLGGRASASHSVWSRRILSRLIESRLRHDLYGKNSE